MILDPCIDLFLALGALALSFKTIRYVFTKTHQKGFVFVVLLDLLWILFSLSWFTSGMTDVGAKPTSTLTGTNDPPSAGAF